MPLWCLRAGEMIIRESLNLWSKIKKDHRVKGSPDVISKEMRIYCYILGKDIRRQIPNQDIGRNSYCSVSAICDINRVCSVIDIVNGSTVYSQCFYDGRPIIATGMSEDFLSNAENSHILYLTRNNQFGRFCFACCLGKINRVHGKAYRSAPSIFLNTFTDWFDIIHKASFVLLITLYIKRSK